MGRPASVLLGIALAALAATAVPAGEEGPALDPRFLAAAREAARFVGRQAIPLPKDAGVRFPEYAESPEEEPTSPLYAGSAGVLVFLENAAALLDDAELRALADRTAAGLLAAPAAGEGKEPPPPPAGNAAGLYTGEAGKAWALLVRFRIRGDRAALAGAVRIAERLAAGMTGDGEAAGWGDGLDVIAGAAGTALLLVEVDRDAPGKGFREAALRAGRFLARSGLAHRGGAAPLPGKRLWWPTAVGQDRHYPNFSHGTAGVAYALARIAAATGDAECREAAVAGGRCLLALAKADGRTLCWPHSLPGQERFFQEGWCHGPSGTGRTLLALYDLTGEKVWLETAKRAAAWVMRERPPEKKTRFYSPSLCCGAAGVLDFFVDAWRATRDPAFRKYALFVGEHLVGLSKEDDGGRKWTNYDRPDEKGLVYHGVSLMLGASGEGLALLRLAAIDRAEDPVLPLPDRGVPAAVPAARRGR